MELQLTVAGLGGASRARTGGQLDVNLALVPYKRYVNSLQFILNRDYIVRRYLLLKFMVIYKDKVDYSWT